MAHFSCICTSFCQYLMCNSQYRESFLNKQALLYKHGSIIKLQKYKPDFHPPCHKSWLKSWYWPGLRRWNKKFTGVPCLIKSTSMLVIETGENGVILFISEPFQKHKMHNCVTPINVLRKLSIWCLIMLI